MIQPPMAKFAPLKRSVFLAEGRGGEARRGRLPERSEGSVFFGRCAILADGVAIRNEESVV